MFWESIGLFFVGIITYAIIWGFLFMINMVSDSEEEFLKSKIQIFFTGLVILSSLVGSFYTIYSKAYVKSIQDVNILEVDFNYNLSNILRLADSLNKKAIVKTENSKIIIDLVNMSQSTKTSDVYISYVNSVNDYNHKLAYQKSIRYDSFMTHLWYGWLYPLSEEVKFISIKE